VLAVNANPFSGASRLYDQLVSYVDGQAWSDEEREGRGMELSGRVLSPQQLQQYLTDKALELELQTGLIDYHSIESQVASGARTICVPAPPHTHTLSSVQIDEMLRLEPDLPRAFWLRCLNCLHHRHERKAFEALHRWDKSLRAGLTVGC
jgi:hypothetical protein